MLATTTTLSCTPRGLYAWESRKQLWCMFWEKRLSLWRRSDGARASKPIGPPPQPVLRCDYLIDCTYLIKSSAFNKNSYWVAYFICFFFFSNCASFCLPEEYPTLSFQFHFHNYFSTSNVNSFRQQLFFLFLFAKRRDWVADWMGNNDCLKYTSEKNKIR